MMQFSTAAFTAPQPAELARVADIQGCATALTSLPA